MRKQKIYIFHVYLQILKTGIHKEVYIKRVHYNVVGWSVCLRDPVSYKVEHYDVVSVQAT